MKVPVVAGVCTVGGVWLAALLLPVLPAVLAAVLTLCALGSVAVVWLIVHGSPGALQARAAASRPERPALPARQPLAIEAPKPVSAYDFRAGMVPARARER